MRRIKANPVLEGMWQLMKLSGGGTGPSGVPRITLPTDPRLLDLTEEQITWIMDMYKDEFPEQFREKYKDPEYDNWEKSQLLEMGYTEENVSECENSKVVLNEELYAELSEQQDDGYLVEEKFD